VEESTGQLLEIAPGVRKKGMKCCNNFHQFKTYCDDIQAYSGTKPKDGDVDLLNLGPFTGIHSL
jgi:hypothetical protein